MRKKLCNAMWENPLSESMPILFTPGGTTGCTYGYALWVTRLVPAVGCRRLVGTAAGCVTDCRFGIQSERLVAHLIDDGWFCCCILYDLVVQHTTLGIHRPKIRDTLGW